MAQTKGDMETLRETERGGARTSRQDPDHRSCMRSRRRRIALTVAVMAEGSHVATVRRAIPLVLRGHRRLDDVLLIVSELVTNALLHGSADEEAVVLVRVARLPFGLVYVGVIDEGRPGGTGSPVSRPGADEDAGLGMVIVDRLAWRWRQRCTRGGGRSVHVLVGR